MLKKLYINNFRCLQNFELKLDNLHSAFLLGRNGSGKTTIFEAVQIFQQIGQGTTHLKSLVKEQDFSFGHKQLPMELEVGVAIEGKSYEYKIEIEFPDNFLYPKIKSENLSVDNKPIMERDGGQTSLNDSAHFLLDWHHIGLPLISVRSEKDDIAIFKNWLSSIVILSPSPRHFHELSKTESRILNRDGGNVLEWVRWLLASNPSLYATMYEFLKFRMPDLVVFKSTSGEERKHLFVFKEDGSIELDFKQLSDGEKIFFLAASIIAAQKNNPSMLCLWDEPDNFIGLTELNHFITDHRRAFESEDSQAQLLITSHNQRVINNFSDHNIFVISRSSHLAPTRLKSLNEIHYDSKTIIDAYDNGELD